MPHDDLERAVAESRAQTATQLREVLRNAPVSFLAKLAVDLAKPLFRDDYQGEPSQTGDVWADAIARPRVAALPTMLIRVHRGEFEIDRVGDLLDAAQTRQAALVIIGPPVPAAIRNALGTTVPWIVDLDGLIHLMITARLGITTRVYETTHVDAGYFR